VSRFPLSHAPGPALSPETLRRIDILYSIEDRDRARTLLYEQCGNNLPFLEKADMFKLERFRFAAMKYSDGNLPKLERAAKLAQQDWRDLLVATGFANDINAHRRWEPKPAGEPAQIDPLTIAATIHEQLATVLVPLGFEREDEEWRRDGEVPQSLCVKTGLTSRTEVRFFLHVTLSAKPVRVFLHLPRLPARMEDLSNQGYIFRAGEREESVCAALMQDVGLYCLPWFRRFTTENEVRHGFEDGTFRKHLRIEDKALIL
jgi:hypothetical protein